MSQQKTKPLDALKKAILMLLNLAMGACMALSVMPWAFKHFKDASLLAFEGALLGALIVFGFLGYVLMVVLHEGGHLLAGLKSGYSFVSFRVFSFMLIKLDGKLTFKRFSLAGTGGQCLMKPPQWTEHGIPVRLYNLGGIMVNAVMCLLALPFVLLLPVDTLPGMMALMTLVIHGYAVLMNGLPLMNNDGDNALHLVNDLPAQHAFWQQMTANALLAEGVPQRDMPPELYALPDHADLTNPLIAAIAVTAAQMKLIHCDFDAARTGIDTLLNNEQINLVPVHRMLLQNDQLWLEVMGDNRSDVIDGIQTKQFQQLRKTMVNFPSVIRTAYTQALSAGSADEAAKQQALMDKIALTYPYASDIEDERCLMQLARDKFSPACAD